MKAEPGEPGAAVIVRKDGRTVFRKGYGTANLELGVPIEPDMVFRLGSVTKQFTAVAILLLAQEGKLGLQDDLTKFLPDYPTQGRRITVEHLLTHTSGIQSYTDMAEWLPLWRKDMNLQELIDVFKNKPLQFEPGASWAYNNSAFVLLGAVIEKASGQSYEAFLEDRIFKPLGLKQTYYDRTERIIPRRAAGYARGNGGFVNASYLSLTQPYAAGSLASTVDDMAAWSDAVFAGKFLRQEWLDKAFAPYGSGTGNPLDTATAGSSASSPGTPRSNTAAASTGSPGSLLTSLLQNDAALMNGLLAVAGSGAQVEVRLNGGALAEAGFRLEAGAEQIRNRSWLKTASALNARLPSAAPN